jgi:ABC-2 type transport system permease protein
LTALSTNIARLLAFKKYSYLLKNLVKKDFTTKYRRSALGVLWSVLNPLLMAAVVSVVFSNIMKIQMENFAVFYLSGALVFNFMSEATNGSLGSIIGSAGLIKKVYIPKYIFPMEKCFFALVNTLFSFVALMLIMPILGMGIHPTALLFWIPLLYTLVFSIGLGMLLATANVFFRDVGHLYGVWVAAWMYLTPVIYPMEMLPAAMQGAIKICNPMVGYVECFRQLVMYGKVPSFWENAACALWAAGALMVGTFVFKRQQDKFILYM